jgi:hypothetical protein
MSLREDMYRKLLELCLVELDEKGATYNIVKTVLDRDSKENPYVEIVKRHAEALAEEERREQQQSEREDRVDDHVNVPKYGGPFSGRQSGGRRGGSGGRTKYGGPF